MVAIDARDGKVALRGWTELSELDAADLGTRLRRGRCSPPARDEHAPRRLARRARFRARRQRFSMLRRLPLIAAGGVATLDDLLALRDAGCEGAIAGSAIWSGRFTLTQAQRAIADQAADESP